MVLSGERFVILSRPRLAISDCLGAGYHGHHGNHGYHGFEMALNMVGDA